ncbi:MAG: M23 family metallopeptidase [Bacteroidales bacterium]
MNKISYIFLFIFIVSPVLLSSQTKHSPESSIHSPVDIPIFLSGNFGELRSGHLHSGIDIKTQGRSGHKLHSIYDGYVSRIKITENGYGKALYIHHPDLNITSVYGHMQSFTEEIEQYVLDNQYQKKSYEIELFPEKNQFKTEKGEFIGFSGNSGSSKGPHLHFEIRSLDNQQPVNPLFYDIKVKDNIPPKIFQVALYPKGKYSSVNNSNDKVILNTRKASGNKYVLEQNDTLNLHGHIGFGLKAHDFMNGSNNWYGIYEVKLLVNGENIYKHQIDEFAFHNTRYINAIIDYEEKTKNNNTIQKLRLLPNNQLNIYKHVKNKGLYNFTKDTTKDITFIVSDEQGNSSSLSFEVKTSSRPAVLDTTTKTHDAIFPYNQSNTFSRKEVKLNIPKLAFYDTVFFQYNKIESDNNIFYSSIHQVHNPYTPVHKYFDLSVKVHNLKSSLKDKIFIAKIKEDNKYDYIGGNFRNGFITARVREFGDFAVLADTLSPIIEPLTNMNKISKTQRIAFRIKDDLSGIKNYNGYIDGQWVLFEYDPKNDLLFHDLSNSPVKFNNKHELELYVSDNKNNIATYYSEIKIH